MKKIIQATINISLCAGLLAASTGCSAFRGHMQTMNINCSPNDAIIMVNGQRYTSPAQVSVKRNRDVSIQAYKEGYAPYQRTIGNHFNETGVLDVVGGCFFLVPFIGLATPGAWTLDETDVTISLYQK